MTARLVNKAQAIVSQWVDGDPGDAAHTLLWGTLVTLIGILPVGAARGDLTKEADGILAHLAELQQSVDRARDNDALFSADMSVVSDLRPLVGLTRAELLAHLGQGRVCAEDLGRDCLLWPFYWKPFSARLTGASPALVATFDAMQRCTSVQIATVQ